VKEDISKKIIALKNRDLEFRDRLIQSGKLNDAYDPEMEKIHLENAAILEKIIDEFGFPTDMEANNAAWLIIQHAISNPIFMKKCLPILRNINPIQYAYLLDRIYVLEGKLQQYGTQFDWDEKGELSPNPYDDLEKVNQRRQTLGLNSLEDQTKLLRIQAMNQNQSPPKNPLKKKKEMEAWRKKVGWIS
jgi:hypothetical protein